MRGCEKIGHDYPFTHLRTYVLSPDLAKMDIHNYLASTKGIAKFHT